MATKDLKITRAKSSTFNFKNGDEFAVMTCIDTGDVTDNDESIFKVVGYPISQKAIAQNCIKKNNFPFFYAYGQPMAEGSEFSISVIEGKMTINSQDDIKIEDKQISDFAKKYGA